MRTLRSKYLSDFPIDENNYKVDFSILDKYQGFSSEILRLSLLGLAIYGFLITNVIFKITNNKQYIFLEPFINNGVAFAMGAASLMFAAVCSLGHRYFSTDCMTHFIRGFRLRKKLAEVYLLENKTDHEISEINTLEAIIKAEEISFEKDLNKCKWLLIISGVLLISGVVLVVSGLMSALGDAYPTFNR